MRPDAPRQAHIRVARTARYWTWGPLDADAPVWFVLHGYRQLAHRFIARFEPLVSAGCTVVAPEALSRFYLDDDTGPHGPDAHVGATWMTREDRLSEIRDYVDYLDALHARILGPATERAVVTLGFSQGAATASRWAALGGAHIDRLILWAGRLPPDLEPGDAVARLKTRALTYVVGADDRWAGPAAIAEEQARLREHGIECTVLDHPGGHRIEEEPLRRLLT
ncbi:MAG: alpha/beta hydrolase [Longimicrobiales bacterium]